MLESIENLHQTLGACRSTEHELLNTEQMMILIAQYRKQSLPVFRVYRAISMPLP